jgi:HAD superfamily hydrolase (TIGR01490 family)
MIKVMEAAFFDLDKTVIAKASMLAFGPPFYKEGMISRRTAIRTAYAQLIYRHLGANDRKLAMLRETVLAITKGWDQNRVTQIVTHTLSEIVEPLIYQEALELMEYHRNQGRLIYLVSASPIEILTPLGEYLDVDGVIGSKSKIDHEGRYTGEMEFYCYGPYKVEAMFELAKNEGLSLKDSYAYSDSYTDIPMLEAVGHPIAVNPDRVLSKRAKEKGWEILTFSKPVRIKDRKRSSKAQTTVAASAAALAVAGLATGAVVRKQRNHSKS